MAKYVGEANLKIRLGREMYQFSSTRLLVVDDKAHEAELDAALEKNRQLAAKVKKLDKAGMEATLKAELAGKKDSTTAAMDAGLRGSLQEQSFAETLNAIEDENKREEYVEAMKDAGIDIPTVVEMPPSTDGAATEEEKTEEEVVQEEIPAEPEPKKSTIAGLKLSK